MKWLTWTVQQLLSQDVARHNAAVATYQLMRQRQERVDVEFYLAGLEHPGPRTTPGTATP